MPYGASTPDLSHVPFTLTNLWSGYSVSSWSMNRRQEKMWRRTGTNFFPMQKATSCKKYTGPLKLVSRQVPGGPKLPYKIWNPKLKKFIWARRLITVYKLIPDYSRVKRVAKGLDIPPNGLNYKDVKVIRADDVSTAKAVWTYDETYKKTLSGALYQNVWIYGGGASALNPDVEFIDVSDYSDLIEAADIKARAKLYSSAKNQEVNLLNALGERKQTIKTLTELLVRLVKTFIQLKKGRIKEAWKTLFPPGQQAKANDFLLFTYGIKPLVDDINGVIKHLNEWEPLTFDIRASSTRSIEPDDQVVTVRAGPYARTTLKTSGKVTVVYKARVKTKDNFNRNLGRLGLTNLGATLWELTPWSFVIDWILPYGDYVNNGDAFGDLEIVHCSKTIFITEEKSWSRDFNGTDSDGWKWSSSDGNNFQTKKTLCTREILDILPELAFPSVKSPFSTGHALNLTALLRQLL